MIIISLITTIAVFAIAAPIGTALGEAATKWLESHFPDVEE